MSTQETVAKQGQQGQPVIPLVPKPGHQNTIPPIPDGKPITKENRGSLPIQFWLTVEDKSSIPSTKTQLPIDLDEGVALTFFGGKAQLKTIASPNQKISPFSFWGIPFLLIFGVACVAITSVMFLTMRKKEITSTATVPPPSGTPIVTPALNAANHAVQTEEKPEIKVEMMVDENAMNTHKFLVTKYSAQSTDLFNLIADKDEAIKIYEEAVELRQKAVKYQDTELLEQATFRLQALLKKSKLPNGYQHHAAKELWMIFQCQGKSAKGAREMEEFLEKRNKKLKELLACPKDGE